MSKTDKIAILAKNSQGGTFSSIKDRKDVDMSQLTKIEQQINGYDVYVKD